MSEIQVALLMISIPTVIIGLFFISFVFANANFFFGILPEGFGVMIVLAGSIFLGRINLRGHKLRIERGWPESLFSRRNNPDDFDIVPAPNEERGILHGFYFIGPPYFFTRFKIEKVTWYEKGEDGKLCPKEKNGIVLISLQTLNYPFFVKEAETAGLATAVDLDCKIFLRIINMHRALVGIKNSDYLRLVIDIAIGTMREIVRRFSFEDLVAIEGLLPDDKQAKKKKKITALNILTERIIKQPKFIELLKTFGVEISRIVVENIDLGEEMNKILSESQANVVRAVGKGRELLIETRSRKEAVENEVEIIEALAKAYGLEGAAKRDLLAAKTVTDVGQKGNAVYLSPEIIAPFEGAVRAFRSAQKAPKSVVEKTDASQTPVEK